MKRQTLLCVLLVGFSSMALCGQETPAAVAERQENEERYKRISADIEDLKASMQSCQQRLNEQREEIRRLGEELTRASANKDLATRDDFKHLADKIKEVDEKRIADNDKLMEKVTAEFNRLGKALSAPPKTAVSEPKPVAKNDRVPESSKTGTEKGYEYVIAQGDTVSGISSKLAKQGLKITQKQIMDANPAVNWNKLRIGQKIFIPAPAP